MNKKIKKIYREKYFKKHPWYSSYNCARTRCAYKYGSYYGKVKFLMTLRDFKTLWFRDRAYLFKEPSVDRINNLGNYELSNCRFIEMRENCIKEKLGKHRSEDTKKKIRESRLAYELRRKRDLPEKKDKEQI